MAGERRGGEEPGGSLGSCESEVGRKGERKLGRRGRGSGERWGRDTSEGEKDRVGRDWILPGEFGTSTLIKPTKFFDYTYNKFNTQRIAPKF